MKQYSQILEKIMNKYNLKEEMKIEYKLLKKIARNEHIDLKDLCCLLQIETVTIYSLKKGKQKRTKLKFDRYSRYEDTSLIEKGKINKEEFAKIKERDGIKTYRLARKLGISMYKYYKMQEDEELEVKVIDIEKKRIVDLIKMDLKYLKRQRAGYYTKQELETACEKRNIDLTLFLEYFSKNEKHYKLNRVILEKSKKGLWIGGCQKMNKNFIVKHYQYLYERLYIVVNKLSKFYKCSQYRDDLVQDAMEHLFSRCGDVVKKFYFDTKLLFNVLMVKAKYLMIQLFFSTYREKGISYNQWDNKYLDHSKILRDNTQNELIQYT